MGRVKDYMMDLDESIGIITEFCSLVESDQFKALVGSNFNIDRFIGFVNHLRDELIYANNNRNIDFELVFFIQSTIPHLRDFAYKILENKSPNFAVNVFVRELNLSVEQFQRLKRNDDKIHVTNTSDYYVNRINELEKRENELLKSLKLTEGRSHEEIIQAKLEAEAAKTELVETKKQLEIKKRQEDAKKNWKNNIEETFSELESYLSPIKIEQDRLNKLFWVYLIASCVLVLVVALIEIIAIVKITKSPAFPDFKQYITLFLPIPIVGAMLWAFIYQMNRAQRQLIVIAKSIHKVEYVQGLLLAINKLAPNVEDGITRINLALDKLVSNHLNEKEVNSEEDIIKEEKKDIVPVDSLIKILKELKGVVGKE